MRRFAPSALALGISVLLLLLLPHTQALANGDLVITEVMYNPAPDAGHHLRNAPFGFRTAGTEEYLVIENVHTSGGPTVNLRDYTMTSYPYTFDLSSATNDIHTSTTDPILLAPGDFVVLVQQRRSFCARYDCTDLDVLETNQALNDNAETLRLYLNGVMQFNAYISDDSPFPIEADGQGPSVRVIDPNGDLRAPLNWRAEYGPGGHGRFPLRSYSHRPAECGLLPIEIMFYPASSYYEYVVFKNVQGVPLDLNGFELQIDVGPTPIDLSHLGVIAADQKIFTVALMTNWDNWYDITRNPDYLYAGETGTAADLTNGQGEITLYKNGAPCWSVQYNSATTNGWPSGAWNVGASRVLINEDPDDLSDGTNWIMGPYYGTMARAGNQYSSVGSPDNAPVVVARTDTTVTFRLRRSWPHYSTISSYEVFVRANSASFSEASSTKFTFANPAGTEPDFEVTVTNLDEGHLGGYRYFAWARPVVSGTTYPPTSRTAILTPVSAEFTPTSTCSVAEGCHLAITEIMYHAGSVTAYDTGIMGIHSLHAEADYDYFVLENIGTADLDLSDYTMDTGEPVTVTFPSVTLSAGEKLYCVSDAIAFRQRYNVPASAHIVEYTGALTDGPSTSTVFITRKAGTVVQAFYIDDTANGFPPEADGQGYALQVVDPRGDYTDSANWKLSPMHGSLGLRPSDRTFLLTEILPYPNTSPRAGSGETETSREDYEFIQFTNFGTSTINLATSGYKLIGVNSASLNFDFATSTGVSVAPGEKVYIVHNTAAFQSRYGTSLKIAGEITAHLSTHNDFMLVHTSDEDLPLWVAGLYTTRIYQSFVVFDRNKFLGRGSPRRDSKLHNNAEFEYAAWRRGPYLGTPALTGEQDDRLWTLEEPRFVSATGSTITVRVYNAWMIGATVEHTLVMCDTSSWTPATCRNTTWVASGSYHSSTLLTVDDLEPEQNYYFYLLVSDVTATTLTPNAAGRPRNGRSPRSVAMYTTAQCDTCDEFPYIAEFMFYPVAGGTGYLGWDYTSASPEYMKICNPADTTFDLTRLSFTSYPYTFDFTPTTLLQTTLGPNACGYLVDYLEYFQIRYDASSVNVIGETNLRMSNSGEHMRLYLDGKRHVWFYFHDAAPWDLSSGAHGGGYSYVLNDRTADLDDRASWDTGTTLYGELPLRLRPVPRLLVVEIMYHPASSTNNPDRDTYGETSYEYIRIKNFEKVPVDISIYTLVCASVNYDLSNSGVTNLGAGQSLVIPYSVEAFQTRYETFGFILASTGSGQALSNGAGTTRIFETARPNFKIFQFTWYDHAPWPTGAYGPDGYGPSLMLKEDEAPLDDGWVALHAWYINAQAWTVAGPHGSVSLLGDGFQPVEMNTVYLTAGSITPTSIGVSWSLPETFGSELAGFTVYYQVGSTSFTGATVQFVDGAETVTTVISGLDSEVDVYVWVQARLDPNNPPPQPVSTPVSDRAGPYRTLACVDACAGYFVPVEIMYNPPRDTGAYHRDYFNYEYEYEWIRMKNLDEDNALSLAGYKWSSYPVNFDFGGTQCLLDELPAGGDCYVVRNLEAFTARYDTTDVTICGEYTGTLSNSYDRFRMLHNGDTLHDFYYDDSYRNGYAWPRDADGKGASLSVINPDTDLGVGTNWEAYANHGSLTLRELEIDPLKIVELNYAPVSSTGKASRDSYGRSYYEYMVLQLYGEEDLDVSGYEFRGHPFYASLSSVGTISPGTRIVLCRRTDALQLRYELEGISHVIQYTSGSMSDSGELITLWKDSVPIVSWRYDDWYPWDPRADGRGYSLVLNDAEGGSQIDPDNWGVSNKQHGTLPLKDLGFLDLYFDRPWAEDITPFGFTVRWTIPETAPAQLTGYKLYCGRSSLFGRATEYDIPNPLVNEFDVTDVLPLKRYYCWIDGVRRTDIPEVQFTRIKRSRRSLAFWTPECIENCNGDISVNEIHYYPRQETGMWLRDYERYWHYGWLRIVNLKNATVDLTDYRFRYYPFLFNFDTDSTISSLGPYESCIIGNYERAFLNRYDLAGTDEQICGFATRGRLNRGRQRVRLQKYVLGRWETMFNFVYDRGLNWYNTQLRQYRGQYWPPEPALNGQSIVCVNPNNQLADADNWVAGEIDGNLPLRQVSNPTIVVDEIHYHPISWGNLPSELTLSTRRNEVYYEYMCFRVISETAVNAEDYVLERTNPSGRGRINRFDFAVSSSKQVFQPNERFCMVRNLAAFSVRHEAPLANVIGEFTRSLWNSRERLTMYKRTNGYEEYEWSVLYADGLRSYLNVPADAWPRDPDGFGPSLIVIDTSKSVEDPANWQQSPSWHGTIPLNNAALAAILADAPIPIEIGTTFVRLQLPKPRGGRDARIKGRRLRRQRTPTPPDEKLLVDGSRRLLQDEEEEVITNDNPTVTVGGLNPGETYYFFQQAELDENGSPPGYPLPETPYSDSSGPVTTLNCEEGYLCNGPWVPRTVHYNPATDSGLYIRDRSLNGQQFEYLRFEHVHNTTNELTIAELGDFTMLEQAPFEYSFSSSEANFDPHPAAATFEFGESGYLVRSREAFCHRYDCSGLKILGEFPSGEQLADGEYITVQENGETNLAFLFNDDDHPAADGTGPPLEVLDPHGDLNDPANWVANSTSMGPPPLRAQVPKLLLVEFMYNPSSDTGEPLRDIEAPVEYEWMMFENVHASAVTITTYLFKNNDPVQWDFASSTTTSVLQPGERVVVARNADAFNDRYDVSSVSAIQSVEGNFFGSLPESAQRITLYGPGTGGAAGLDIAEWSFEYDVGAPWPSQPYNLGHSLQVVDTEGDITDPANWQAGPVHGTIPLRTAFDDPCAATSEASCTAQNREPCNSLTAPYCGTCLDGYLDPGAPTVACEAIVCDPACANGGECTEQLVCDCEGTGYQGETCTESNPCTNAPNSTSCAALNREACDTQTAAYTDACDACLPGYESSTNQAYGTDQCTPVCDPACDHGTCVGAGVCECEIGWTGDLCDTVDTSECADSPDTLCASLNRDPCDPAETAPLCGGCSAGYEGATGVNEQCTTACDTPCENGGTCIGDNVCSCATGWDGPTCSDPICNPACVRGSCVGPDTCDCTGTGYTGPTCDTLSCTCINGGQCVNGTCDCPPDYYFFSCECHAPSLHDTTDRALSLVLEKDYPDLTSTTGLAASQLVIVYRESLKYHSDTHTFGDWSVVNDTCTGWVWDEMATDISDPNDCVRYMRGRLDWSVAYDPDLQAAGGCGITLTTLPDGRLEFFVDFAATVLETLEPLREGDPAPTRTITQKMPFTLIWDTEISINSTIGAYAPVRMIPLLTKQEVIGVPPDNVTAHLELMTEVQFPFKLTHARWDSYPATVVEEPFLPVGPITIPSQGITCSNNVTAEEICTQIFQIELTPFFDNDTQTIPCSFDGTYRVEFDIGCRTSGCPTTSSDGTSTAIVEFTLDTSSHCPTLIDEIGATGTMRTYKIDTYTSENEKDDFLDTQTVYVQARVSTAEVALSSTVLADLYFEDTGSADRVDLLVGGVRQPAADYMSLSDADGGAADAGADSLPTFSYVVNSTAFLQGNDEYRIWTMHAVFDLNYGNTVAKMEVEFASEARERSQDLSISRRLQLGGGGDDGEGGDEGGDQAAQEQASDDLQTQVFGAGVVVLAVAAVVAVIVVVRRRNAAARARKRTMASSSSQVELVQAGEQVTEVEETTEETGERPPNDA